MTKVDDRIPRIRAYLAADGFSLLDEEWCGTFSQYRFRCTNHHVSAQLGASLLRRLRGVRGALVCEQCWIEQLMTRLHDAALAAGGRCLSNQYESKSAKYPFVCAVGHKFEASAASVLDGHWCATCSSERRADRRRYQGGLQPIQDRAREFGGECLSTEYTGVRNTYLFRCKDGHEWSMHGFHILVGGWCAICRMEERQRSGLERMRTIANERGGTCLSGAYIDNNTKLEWECARGHRWWARPRQVGAGNWCAQCSFLSQITQEKTQRKRRYEPSGPVEV
ncbi:hypothetical protein [Paraburkholderia guartelaensis]|uniref:hypothetical protein n=1 Tax=Paraburkholderia guartelaensis TaxID=2546446 RepID=UPI002AB7436F|nr:hypothetical protein [Paraburkholderia guartelaensis]